MYVWVNHAFSTGSIYGFGKKLIILESSSTIKILHAVIEALFHKSFWQISFSSAIRFKFKKNNNSCNLGKSQTTVSMYVMVFNFAGAISILKDDLIRFWQKSGPDRPKNINLYWSQKRFEIERNRRKFGSYALSMITIQNFNTENFKY